MDWMQLQALCPSLPGLPARASRLIALGLVLAGRQYDVIEAPFSEERSASGEYVPLAKRRPTVRTGICRTVVDDSVSMLFGEDHFPHVVATDPETRSRIAALMRDIGLPQTMLAAARVGSVGSVALLLHVIERRVVVTPMTTATLTPAWQRSRPGRLASVTERYQVAGADLVADGYALPVGREADSYWFQRVWDAQAEIWYQPQSLLDATAGKPMLVDMGRTFEHGLGSVPVVWIRNLATTPSMPLGKRTDADPVDGDCTFEVAIDTVIETDYLLSQAGRALKYGADPTLVLKSGMGEAEGPARSGGAAQALELPPEGDAKLLEINGSAAEAVLEHVRYLRTLALESIHGNRADSDRLTAAQSGKALELMNAALCQLTGRLRQSYGEGGLLELLRMICAASRITDGGLLIADEETDGVVLDPDGLELRWPAYFRPTNTDLLQTAQALVTAKDGKIASQKTAVTAYAALTDVDDAAQELADIQSEQAAAADLAEQQADANSARAVKLAAAAGQKQTATITA